MRIVITGLGTVNALGNSVSEFWTSIKEGRSGVDAITNLNVSNVRTKIAAQLKNFDPRQYLDRRETKRFDPFSIYAVISTMQAWEQAGLEAAHVDPKRMGCVLGVGLGGMHAIEHNVLSVHGNTNRSTLTMSVPMAMSNSGPANIALKFNIQGPTQTISTACASSTDAIGTSIQLLKNNICDVIVTGGSEAIITLPVIEAFTVLHATTTSHNDNPKTASRPFDLTRDGFVIGEGAGILILERLDHALKRSAPIFAEVVGYGASTDAYHITAPHPEGKGAIHAMTSALESANIVPEHIDYINAHGTSTKLNDAVETKIIKSVFKEHAKKLKISSTKSMTGHCIGATGAIEAISCVLAIKDQFYPPTINYSTPDPDCDLDYVPNIGYTGSIEYTMSNSLGFGGHNSILILKKFCE